MELDTPLSFFFSGSTPIEWRLSIERTVGLITDLTPISPTINKFAQASSNKYFAGRGSFRYNRANFFLVGCGDNMNNTVSLLSEDQKIYRQLTQDDWSKLYIYYRSPWPTDLNADRRSVSRFRLKIRRLHSPLAFRDPDHFAWKLVEDVDHFLFETGSEARWFFLNRVMSSFGPFNTSLLVEAFERSSRECIYYISHESRDNDKVPKFYLNKFRNLHERHARFLSMGELYLSFLVLCEIHGLSRSFEIYCLPRSENVRVSYPEGIFETGRILELYVNLPETLSKDQYNKATRISPYEMSGINAVFLYRAIEKLSN